jgi:TolB-like protein/DNA-binding winged helix-turn-helix (wHTH) protein/Tfp pilus assembly protein PilF
MSSPRRVVRFGTYEVDVRTGEVRKSGLRLRIQEKPLQVLLYLLERPGELVTRDELRERLWADTFVDFDHSLGTAIAKLRSALGDSARSPRFIETVGGRGYRFIAPVTVDEPAAAVVNVPAADAGSVAPVESARPRRSLPRAAIVVAGLGVGAAILAVVLQFDVAGVRQWLRRQTSPPVRSIAVLPLANLSGDADEFFVDGMTDQLITTLAQLPRTRVVSRMSVMRYKGNVPPLSDIRRALDVDAVVEGTVVRDGDRIRVTAQLIDARTDQHLWAQSYERGFADFLTLQNDIARAIADEIRIQLTPQESTTLRQARAVIPAAHEAYLRGRYRFNKGEEAEIRKSVEDFNEAIRLDPSAAPAYAGLAQAYIALTDFYERPTQAMPRARAAAEAAVMHDERLSDAHTALGAVRFLYDWDWKGAETAFSRAIALNPASADAHVWFGVFLAQMGRFDAATAEMRRATELDPLSVPVRISAGWVYYLARDSTRALTEWKKALDLEPNISIAHTSIWMAYAQQGKSPPLPPSVTADVDASPLNLATLAGAYAMSGNRNSAEAILARIKALGQHRYVCSYEIATAHAALHQHDEAIAWLRRGIDERSACMPDLKVDPRFDDLRRDPRFIAMLREIGFAV